MISGFVFLPFTDVYFIVVFDLRKAVIMRSAMLRFDEFTDTPYAIPQSCYAMSL